MELLADRDPEEARKILDPVLNHMMEAVHRYEGTVNQVMGDGIMALFGAPLAHEDHAVRGCYAALAMQGAVKRYADDMRRNHGVTVRIRVGLNSGEVVVRTIGSDLRMDYTAVGQTTHLAARMEQLADPGATLLTADTLALAEGYIDVRSVGPTPVKGMAEPVEVYEMLGASTIRSRFAAAAARGLTTFVGRTDEIEQLSHALDRAKTGRGQVIGVVGEPGVGKSRLYYEFTHSHRVQDCLLIESVSVSYGKATAYLPVIELLRSYFRIEGRDDERIVREKVTGRLLSLDRALEPFMAAFLWLLDVSTDDPQWERLDPPQRRQQTLDGVKRLLLRESQVQPVVVVFEDLHWIDAETQALVDALVESLPAARVLLLVNYRPEYQHAWGSKMYYRQLRIDPLPAASAHELLDALLGDDATVRPLKPLLVQRTEGTPFFLEESVRMLVETRVLLGGRGAYRLQKPLSTIEVPATVKALLAARIDRLSSTEKGVLQAAAVIGTDVPFGLLQAIAGMPDEDLRQHLAQLRSAEFLYETNLFPELEHTFKHALTHEVAYGTLLGDRRRTLHARIVEAIERLFAGRLTEQVEQLAHHAVRGEVWDRAVTYLHEAGAKAFRRSTYAEAIAYLTQGLELAGRLPPGREQVRQELRMLLAAHHAMSPSTLWTGESEATRRHGETGMALYDREAHASLAFLYGGHDPGVCCRMHLGMAFWFLGYPKSALERSRSGLALARDLGHLGSTVSALPFAMLIHQLRGDRAILHELVESLITLSTEHGSPQWLLFGKAFAAWFQAEQEGGEAAIARLRGAIAEYRATGNELCVPMLFSLLATALLKNGAADEGLDAIADAQAMADATGTRLWDSEYHRLKGELLLARDPAAGQEAEIAFRQAIEIARGQSAKSWELRAAVSLGRLWQRQGKRQEAARLLAEIHGWFTEGFDTVDLMEAKSLLDRLSAAST